MPWNPNQEDSTDSLIGQVDCTITKLERKRNSKGNLFLWITFEGTNKVKTRAQFYLTDGALKRLAAVYRAVGKGDTVIDDPVNVDEHSMHLIGCELRAWWHTDPDNAQYTVIVGVGPAGTDCPANLDWNKITSTQAAASVAGPVIKPKDNDKEDLDRLFGGDAPEAPDTDAAELDAVFGGAPEQPRVSSENQIPDEVLPF